MIQGRGQEMAGGGPSFPCGFYSVGPGAIECSRVLGDKMNTVMFEDNLFFSQGAGR